MQLLIMGPPGAGKGTQAKIIADHLRMPAISTGDIFRSLQTQDTPLARQVRQIMATGGYVSDEVTDQIVAERISQPDCSDGFILDGYPRTPGQVDALDRMLSHGGRSLTGVLSLTVSQWLLVERLTHRAEAEKRADDSAEVVRTRLSVYAQQTAPLLATYAARGLLHDVDGEGAVGDVTARLLYELRQLGALTA